MKPDSKPYQRWFGTVLPLLTVFAVLYLYLHDRIPGQERVELTDKEKAQVNALVTDSATGTVAKPQIRDAVVYIRAHYQLADPSAEREIINFLGTFRRPQDLLTGLNEYSIRIHSYFWLTRDWLFAEILFWTLFGVTASLLYNVSEALRKGADNFDPDEIPTHVAKLFYTPFCTTIIYLSINLLVNDNTVQHMEFSAGQIVLAFVLGFFSGRTIDLLNRIKDVLLPLGKAEPDPQPTRDTTSPPPRPPGDAPANHADAAQPGPKNGVPVPDQRQKNDQIASVDGPSGEEG